MPIELNSGADADFLRGILLKIAFHPEKIKRAMAFLIYTALRGKTFTADCIPSEIVSDNTTSGCAVRMLTQAKMGLGFIEFVSWVTSPSKSRHGAPVKSWRLTEGRRSTAITWLERNGFPAPPNDTADLPVQAEEETQNGELQPAAP